MKDRARVLALHGGVLLALLAAHFVLPPYHHGNLARIMVLASYAMGYNIVFGYTGLLSLGHALFFAAGMYGMGLAVQNPAIGPGAALLIGAAAGSALAAGLGLLALRTTGVAFMIVTLMFAQAGYLSVLYFADWTRGDEGFVIAHASRILWGIDLSNASYRYLAAWALFVLTMGACLWLVRAPVGRSLIAIRENEPRLAMLGYDTFRLKLMAMTISGTIAGASGAVYAVLFGYAGASFAGVEYSILPLLWVLLGGAGTVLGPFIGTLFMFYLIDLSSGLTTAYMLIAGATLVLLTLFAPQGMMGEVRRRIWGWLP